MNVYLLILLLCFSQLRAQENISVGLNPFENTKAFTFKTLSGTYQTKYLKISKSKQLSIKVYTGYFTIGESTQRLTSLFLKPNDKNARFTLFDSRSSHLKSSYSYQGTLTIKLEDNKLTLINTCPLPEYLSGVIQAEAGTEENTEYYKVQAIICRTYALSYLFRHKESGYNLCNTVHCQVFKGTKVYNSNITKAVKKTKDLLLVDQNAQLAHTLFHSNCGGETEYAQNVWTSEKHYLSAVKDSFCSNKTHATWTKKMPLSEVELYFHHQMGVPKHLNLSDYLKKRVDASRAPFFIEKECYDSKSLRKAFNWPSAFFKFSVENDTLQVYGKGFGHGVGLCQEGAMVMSYVGKKYREILRHYYKDTHLIRKKDLSFFQEKEDE